MTEEIITVQPTGFIVCEIDGKREILLWVNGVVIEILLLIVVMKIWKHTRKTNVVERSKNEIKWGIINRNKLKHSNRQS